MLSLWQPIETASKGSGTGFVTSAEYVKPPKLLLLVDGCLAIGYWDWYYAEGGWGFRNGQAWVNDGDGSPFDVAPSHWMPLPDPPEVTV